MQQLSVQPAAGLVPGCCENPAMSDAAPSSTAPLWAICLCAEWCGTCRDWHAVMQQLAADHPGMRCDWLDIEDETDLLDTLGIDIETFPTMLLARQDQVLFFGPVPAQADVLGRLVGSLANTTATPPGIPAEASALWRALRARQA